MKVSVIVPFLNEEAYIEQCLQALLGQDLPREDCEVIFVDNGSSDRSAEIVRRYPQIILLKQDRPGCHAARNKGLEVARGQQVIAFTDADCVPSKDWLRQVCDGMARMGAAIAVGPLRLPHRGRRVLQLCEDHDNARAAHVVRLGVRQHMFASGSNMAMRTDVIQAAGPFAEWMRGGDAEYVQRCLGQLPHANVVYLPDMVVTHLEITGLNQWLKKRALYGETTSRVERESTYRPASYKERIRAYRACADAHHYSVWRRLCLLGVIGLGVLWFETGRLRGALEGRRAGDQRFRQSSDSNQRNTIGLS